MQHSLHTQIAHVIRQDATYKLVDTLANAVFAICRLLKRGVKLGSSRPTDVSLGNRQMS